MFGTYNEHIIMDIISTIFCRSSGRGALTSGNHFQIGERGKRQTRIVEIRVFFFLTNRFKF